MAARLRRFLLIGAACGLLVEAVPAGAASRLSVQDAWSRPTPPGVSVGVVYLNMKNAGGPADRLLRLHSPVASSVQLHETRMQNGIMAMRPLPFMDVPADAEMAATPGGVHIMLLGLKSPLKAGDGFPLTLVFAHAGEITVDVTVRKAL